MTEQHHFSGDPELPFPIAACIIVTLSAAMWLVLIIGAIRGINSL